MSDQKLPDNFYQIAEMRDQHIGRLLLRAQRAFSVRSIQKLRQMGHSGLTLAHTNLLAHLDMAGTRITVLAERTGVSKQAVGQLVLELEEKGYIGRTVDASDRRAVIITFTVAGWQFLIDADQIKREIEAEYTAILGPAGFQNLRALLTSLIENQDEQLPANEE
jgi:DNA-binding MarR family transcriptional regulator